ncbi:hypothetical protein Esi_0215_0016 [Ectocarpus siliculosus]|uniref:Uncharacterized protein n=1 Tax=Ectocarpus siliculosus TaxID=2880 RepID=D7FRI7_ECTSI|nr:hypothetical protein Esi_0215_0016 [Ectocarpus siliculosus]|eukprot:CBJ30778.1 hypothetical protein Esi_0215_0016 [Ectocarpus siliculosus]
MDGVACADHNNSTRLLAASPCEINVVVRRATSPKHAQLHRVLFSLSQVEIYVEVTQTEVFIPAAEAWNDVAADTITTVTPSASWSVAGFGPNMTTYADELVGSSTTVPGTPLGEGERVNLIRPLTVSLGIHFNLSAGAIVSISEVELFVQTPDATPTPAPFVPTPETEAPVYSWMNGDDSDDYYMWANDDDDAAGVVVSSDDDHLVEDSSSSTATDEAGGVTGGDDNLVDDSSSSTANDEAGGDTSGDDGPTIGLPSSTGDDADDAADIDNFGNGALARGGVCSRQGLVGVVAVGAMFISFAANAM